MKQESVRRALSGGIWSASALALALVAWLAAGCGQRSEDVSAVDLSEVRGEPIQAPPTEPAMADVKVVPADPEEDAGARVAAEPDADSVALDATAEVMVASGTEVESQPKVEVEAEVEMTGTPDDPLEVGFDRLAAFQYDLPEGPVDTAVVKDVGASAQIPGSIKGLNEQFIALKGFMLPLKVEKGLVTELLLMRDQSMCC
jgi:hypothetical protein